MSYGALSCRFFHGKLAEKIGRSPLCVQLSGEWSRPQCNSVLLPSSLLYQQATIPYHKFKNSLFSLGK